MVVTTNLTVETHNSIESIIAELQADTRSLAVDLSLAINRITANYHQSYEKKALTREQTRLILNSSTDEINNIIRHIDGINLALSDIKSTAEAVLGEPFKSTSLAKPSTRPTTAERVVVLVNQLRNNFAQLNYFGSVAQADNYIVPKIPGQQPAPIRVEIVGNQLDLTSSQTIVGPLSMGSLERLRAATQELLGRTIDQIGSSSNIDPRLAPNLTGLNTYLSNAMADMPIEALGMNFQFARRSFNSTKETVPDTLAEQIDQILATVNVILNQYEEWRLYVAAEASLSMSPSSMQAAVEISQEVEIFFEKNADLVEPKLIARLKEITDSYSQGLVNLESVAVPLIESLGNIFSELSRFVISQSPASAGVVGTSGAVVLFLGFAIKSIETFTPTLSGFPPLSYLIDVQKFAHKQFSLIKDSLPGT